MLREKRSQALPEEEPSTSVEVDLSQNSAVAPLEECLDTFWESGEALNSFTVNPALPEVDNAILKRLGNAPFTVGKDNIASLLAKAYTVASSAALRVALGKPQED